MGLEKHVDKVLADYDWDRPVEYRWENGLIVDNITDAHYIMRVLDDSGQFSPTFYDTIKSEIVFGNFTDGNVLKAFKKHIRNMDDKRKEDLLIALIHDLLEDDFFEYDNDRLNSMKESVENISGIEFLESIY